jgi:hypothetical protein
LLSYSEKLCPGGSF